MKFFYNVLSPPKQVCVVDYCLSCSPSQVISCDQNLNRCCELIELSSKIQSQLFTILNLAATEGMALQHLFLLSITIFSQ